MEDGGSRVEDEEGKMVKSSNFQPSFSIFQPYLLLSIFKRQFTLLIGLGEGR